jgi:RNA polymerase sigma-70 factor (ECF subfamily)
MRVDAGIALPVDYARLVRLCARLSGDRQAAEDLAQDTLVEAWRQRHKLREPTGGEAWLSAIARNVCLRWAAARRRDREYTIAPRPGEYAVVPGSVARVADTIDVAGDLERVELATLVDEALALLPATTRAVLIERYMRDTP